MIFEIKFKVEKTHRRNNSLMNIGQRTTSDNYEMEFGHPPITVKVTHMKFMAKSRNIRLVFVGHNCMILVKSDESFSQGP